MTNWTLLTRNRKHQWRKSRNRCRAVTLFGPVATQSKGRWNASCTFHLNAKGLRIYNQGQGKPKWKARRGVQPQNPCPSCKWRRGDNWRNYGTLLTILGNSLKCLTISLITCQAMSTKQTSASYTRGIMLGQGPTLTQERKNKGPKGRH